jgi:hypothetical protein
MKKILTISTLFILIIGFSGCEKNCIKNRPKDIKSIDWNYYNDVYTVYWNYYSLFSERKQDDEGKIIKISGWKIQSADGFALCDDPKYAEDNSGYTASPPRIEINGYYVPELQNMLDTCDFKKKCFINGQLSFFEIHSGSCLKCVPEIIITDINDIYFE